MTALAQLSAAPPLRAAPPSRRAEGEPVALLQLDCHDAEAAASAVYREARAGRPVVVVACGGADAARRLEARLDRIGVETRRGCPGGVLIDDGVTVVAGPEAPPPVRPIPAIAPLRVALAGCGVVGGGVLARLGRDPRFEVVGVLVRDQDKSREPGPGALAVTDPAALLAREPDVLIDALSDASTSLALIRAALTRGVDVITAGKQAVAADPKGLSALAARCGARLAWSAAVGGGAPIVETVRRARRHGPIARIEAVLNGTCNFILNRLAEGQTFDTAVSAVQAAGFAEADPSDDLSGRDAAAKLVILAWEAGTPVDLESVKATGLPREAIGPKRLRQLALLEAGSGSVGCIDIADDPLFARLADEGNVARITTADGRIFIARGRGAGRAPTTESVWADLTDLLAVRHENGG